MGVRIGDLDLVPYVFGLEAVSRPLFERMPDDTFRLDVFGADPARDFGALLNAANALAFGDLGMPLWVQLDCATVPTAYHGFAAPRDDLPGSLWSRLFELVSDGRLPPDLVGRLEDYAGPVPVSGYCAALTSESGVVVGFSLFSLLPGLGVRTKALGLRAHDAHRQIGITQYDNPVLRTHCAFGRLRIIEPEVPLHSRAGSFAYELDLPAADVLEAMALEGIRPVEPVAYDSPTEGPFGLLSKDQLTLVVSDATADVIRSMSRGRTAWIVPPGRVRIGDRACVVVAVEGRPR